MSILLQLDKFFKLTSSEKRIFIICLIISGLFSIVIQILPLRYYYGVFKKTNRKKLTPSEISRSVANLIKAMERVKKIAFWDCSCLNQVMTLKYLSLKTGIPSSVKFNLNKFGGKNYRAHATIIFDGEFEYLALKENKNQHIELYIT